MGLWTVPKIFSLAILLRAILLLYGLYQDAHSAMKYTDIDYLVFTDAARFVYQGRSPYDRATYRYTPLLAWMLIPTAWSPGNVWAFSFGKILFAVADIVAGALTVRVLRSKEGGAMSTERALKYASIWLLNPMVATISTRGSSEGLLGVTAVALLWAVMRNWVGLAGVILGLAVHLKIYPFIYAPAIVWWLDEGKGRFVQSSERSLLGSALAFCTPARIKLALSSFAAFMALNALMYYIYGLPFLEHTFTYHLTRTDHRHNFSPYSTILYLSSSPIGSSILKFPLPLSRLAFLPQLFLSAFAIPLVLARRDLPATMLAQTFAFVSWNKVCTSQYFLWYLVFLPFYLPRSSLLSKPWLGMTAGLAWAGAQALWLQQAYQLEFLGQSTFVPGLWISSLVFFFVNTAILCIIVGDIGRNPQAMDVGLQPSDKKVK